MTHRVPVSNSSQLGAFAHVFQVDIGGLEGHGDFGICFAAVMQQMDHLLRPDARHANEHEAAETQRLSFVVEYCAKFLWAHANVSCTTCVFLSKGRCCFGLVCVECALANNACMCVVVCVCAFE